jgi:hypothetical protein
MIDDISMDDVLLILLSLTLFIIVTVHERAEEDV